MAISLEIGELSRKRLTPGSVNYIRGATCDLASLTRSVRATLSKDAVHNNR